MDKKKLREAMLRELDDYCANEEAYGDDAYLEVNTTDNEARIISDAEADVSPHDCYPVMSLLCPDMTDPAMWQPDEESIDEVLNGE